MRSNLPDHDGDCFVKRLTVRFYRDAEQLHVICKKMNVNVTLLQKADDGDVRRNIWGWWRSHHPHIFRREHLHGSFFSGVKYKRGNFSLCVSDIGAVTFSFLSSVPKLHIKG